MMAKVIDFEYAKRLFRRDKSSRLARQISATLCPGMTLPGPLLQLFTWIETNHLYIDTSNGRLGFLFPDAEMKAGWTERGRPGGTDISFAAEGDANLRHWFRSQDPEITRRLCVFAKTGGDGSTAAFWLDDDGVQKIVQLGSGSGSTTVCILADEPVDFLRLLAIGYDEICWGEALSQPPSDNTEFLVQPNRAFAEWVKHTFDVTVPELGTDIVKYPISMDAEVSPDPFWQWVRKVSA